jgi:hypothetical protein
MFEGFEWICTHCRIWDKLKENQDRANRGEPPQFDGDSEMSVDEDKITTPPEPFNLADSTEAFPSLMSHLTKGMGEWLPLQFGLQNIVRDAYDGYQADVERRYKPKTKEAITV